MRLFNAEKRDHPSYLDMSSLVEKRRLQRSHSEVRPNAAVRENKKEIFMKAKNKSFKLLMVLSLLMCLVGINLFKTSNVFAADYGNKFITGHELTDDLGNTKTDFGIYDDVQAHWDFDIPVGSVSQGDTMSVNVPDLLTLSKDITFEIKD